MSGSRARSMRVVRSREIATHTAFEWEVLKRICGSTCLRCGGEGRRLEKDHITPLHQGGSDGIWNLQPLCARCNCSKGRESYDYRPEGWWDRLGAIEDIAAGQSDIDIEDDYG